MRGASGVRRGLEGPGVPLVDAETLVGWWLGPGNTNQRLGGWLGRYPVYHPPSTHPARTTPVHPSPTTARARRTTCRRRCTRNSSLGRSEGDPRVDNAQVIGARLGAVSPLAPPYAPKLSGPSVRAHSALILSILSISQYFSVYLRYAISQVCYISGISQVCYISGISQYFSVFLS